MTAVGPVAAGTPGIAAAAESSVAEEMPLSATKVGNVTVVADPALGAAEIEAAGTSFIGVAGFGQI